MTDNFDVLETGQIEIMHQQVHDRIGSDDTNCDDLRQRHDSLAAELVKRGVIHDTEVTCPESELGQRAPNYRRGFTDDVCSNCAFGQLHPFCNLYKSDYTKDYVCDSFRYFEILELDPPHGFLVAQQKQTAISSVKPLDTKNAKLIVSGGEAFGIAILESNPVQLKTKDFDSEEWQDQHRIIPRERRQWWPESETFYVYRIKDWQPYDGIKLYRNGKVIDEPRLTSSQWKMVSTARDLPKQITLIDDAVSVTEKSEFVINPSAKCDELVSILSATYQTDVAESKSHDELIPVYSLALVRHPRMRVKKSEKQEGDDMPYELRVREDEFCVVKINPDETEETVACHETREGAEAQITALRINVEEGESARYTDKPKKRKPRAKKDTFTQRIKKAAKSILDAVTLAETEENEDKQDLLTDDYGVAQKRVNGKLWHFTYSTNAFEDREGEIFSTRGLENYVSNNENNSDKGYFNLWHINAEDGHFNTDFARKEWQGVIGRFLVEAGPYLDNDKGRSAKGFFKQYASGHPEIAPEGWGCSPEYRYLPEERATGTYDTIWITRTSTLPKFMAANVWTETRQLGGQKMALSDKQKEAAIEMFGDEFVSQMMAEAEQKTAELESAGVAHKAKEEGEQEPQQVSVDMGELAAEVGKQFSTNLQPITDAITAMSAELNELKEWKEKKDKESEVKAVTETPRYIFNLQRASENEDTIVTEDDGLKDAKPNETNTKSNDPWSQVFNK